jgi:hypothetical protein
MHEYMEFFIDGLWVAPSRQEPGRADLCTVWKQDRPSPRVAI